MDIALGVGMIAVLLFVWQACRQAAPAKPATVDRAYTRGLEYAFVQLFKASDQIACMAELRQEAELGQDMDPSPFDLGIMAAVDQAQHHLDSYYEGILSAIDRLNTMLHLGEASQVEVGTALDVLGSMLEVTEGRTLEEPTVFVTEYMRLEGTDVVLHHRSFAEAPTWAKGFKSQVFGNGEDGKAQTMVDFSRRDAHSVDLKALQRKRHNDGI